MRCNFVFIIQLVFTVHTQKKKKKKIKKWVGDIRGNNNDPPSFLLPSPETYISTGTLSFLMKNQNWTVNLINQKHNYVLYRFVWDRLGNCKQTYYYKVSWLTPTETL